MVKVGAGRLSTTTMRRALFDYVEHIRKAEKYFAVSAARIARELAAVGRCEVTTVYEWMAENGEQLSAELRLNMSGRREYPNTWKVALKLHRTRIDGIDFEPRFRTRDGTTERGWHRHHWNTAEDSADRDKVPIRDFDTARNREQFLVRAMNILRITLDQSSDGETDDLPFD